jgi:hypothetical protein
MLIVCFGEDSFRVLEKARELENAYRMKYDKEGHSIERPAFLLDGIERLLSSASGASLFSERRFVRLDDLITSCPKEKRESVLRALRNDVERMIVVSAERGKLNEKDLKSYRALPKLVLYDHPALSPYQFGRWAQSYALKNGFKDTKRVQRIAAFCQGDSWFFVNEFWKMRAGGDFSETGAAGTDAYGVVDRFLQKYPTRWSFLRTYGDTEEVMTKAGHQSRMFSLVRSDHTEGVHPYVVKKLSAMKNTDAEERFRSLMTSFIWSRTGMASADEALDALG